MNSPVPQSPVTQPSSPQSSIPQSSVSQPSPEQKPIDSKNSNENKIFKYFDGESEVFADPSELDYKFMKASEGKDLKTLDKWMEAAPEGKETEEAAERRVNLFIEACHQFDPIIRKTFDIKPFDKKTGVGLTHEDTMKLWGEYLEWRTELKKNTD